MTMKLPQKAGFAPTVQEWDQLVRIAENLAAQLAQRDAAQRLAQAELDAARAEVARLTAALKEYGWHLDNCPAADCSTTKCECGYAALRQPAPARLRCTCENFPDGEEEGEGAVMTIRNRNCPIHADKAPAQGQE